MNINITAASFRKGVTELAAVAAVVVPAIDQVPLPGNIRPVIVAIGGIILAVSHALTARKVTAGQPPAVETPQGLKWSAVAPTPAGPPAIAD